jgi:hypothetical protein
MRTRRRRTWRSAPSFLLLPELLKADDLIALILTLWSADTKKKARKTR